MQINNYSKLKIIIVVTIWDLRRDGLSSLRAYREISLYWSRRTFADNESTHDSILKILNYLLQYEWIK